jgi:hypothetical protein
MLQVGQLRWLYKQGKGRCTCTALPCCHVSMYCTRCCNERPGGYQGQPLSLLQMVTGSTCDFSLSQTCTVCARTCTAPYYSFCSISGLPAGGRPTVDLRLLYLGVFASTSNPCLQPFVQPARLLLASAAVQIVACKQLPLLEWSHVPQCTLAVHVTPASNTGVHCVQPVHSHPTSAPKITSEANFFDTKSSASNFRIFRSKVCSETVAGRAPRILRIDPANSTLPHLVRRADHTRRRQVGGICIGGTGTGTGYRSNFRK